MKNLIEVRKRLDKVDTKTKKYSYPRNGVYFLFEHKWPFDICLGYTKDGKWLLKRIDSKNGKIFDVDSEHISGNFAYIAERQAQEMQIEMPAQYMYRDPFLISGLVHLRDNTHEANVDPNRLAEPTLRVYKPNIIQLKYKKYYYIVIDTDKYVSRVDEAKLKEARDQIASKQEEHSKYAESIIDFINKSEDLSQEDKSKLLDAYFICDQSYLLKNINAFG